VTQKGFILLPKHQVTIRQLADGDLVPHLREVALNCFLLHIENENRSIISSLYLDSLGD